MSFGMAGRTSTRSSSSRDQASAPPKKASQRVDKASSPAVRTRRTRSESRDPDNDLDVRTRKTARSRDIREGSTDSTSSNASKDGRRRKNNRAAEALIQELSIVTEEQVEEQVEEQIQEQIQEQIEDIANATKDPHSSQSPNGLSRLSGTTALTTQSAQKMENLDVGMLVELIPDLSYEAIRLTELLIPSSVSSNTVAAIVNELQVPGSGRDKRLRLREKTFYNIRENYGNNLFIDPLLILRKMFDKQDLGPEQFRPDVILHAANIATLVKELLVAQRDDPNTAELLQRLDDVFPTPFLSGFESDPKFGTSAMLQASFVLALDLRTQTVIGILKAYRDEMNFDPDQILAQLFYELPEERNDSVSTFEDLIVNGRLRRIAGISVQALALDLDDDEVLDGLSALLHQRVELLRKSFYPDKEAITDNGFVDFDELNDHFPWLSFLADVVSWSRLRLDEIKKGVEAQGGIEKIANLLSEQIKASNEQIELFGNQPGFFRKLQTQGSNTGVMSNVTIIPASAGKSLYKSSRSVEALAKNLEPTLSASPSNQQSPSVTLRDKISMLPPTQGTTPSAPGPIRSSPTPEPDMAVNLDVEQTTEIEDPMSDSGVGSVTEVYTIHEIGERYTIKENQPVNGHGDGNATRLRFVDRQPNAQRVSPLCEGDEFGEEKRKDRPEYHLEGHDDEGADEDDGDDEDNEDAFQNDDRPLDLTRRGMAAIQVAQARNIIPQSSPKRRLAGLQEGDDGEMIAERPEKRRRLQKRIPVQNEELNDDEVRRRALQAGARVGDMPSASYATVTETARASVAVAMSRRSIREPQKRIPWSEAETQLLLELVARHGSNWSTIQKVGQGVFSDSGRDQVALKDKARNMKVNYLLCGVDLPCGFDAIALGKKEKDRVKSAGLNPYRLEYEIVGHESHDMNGDMM